MSLIVSQSAQTVTPIKGFSSTAHEGVTGAGEVVIGVDTHADTHTAVVIDAAGRWLDERTFPTSTAGYKALTCWATSFGPVRGAGVECTGSYGAGLARYLNSAQIPVIEVNQPHTHTRARIGKTDSIDAEAAARKVLSRQVTAVVKETTGGIESIRNLTMVRNLIVKNRTQYLNQLKDLIVTAPADLRAGFRQKTLPAKAAHALKLRPNKNNLLDPVEAVKLAMRTVARQISNLTIEADALEKELKALTEHFAPTLLALPQVGTISAAQLLITAGENLGRIHNEASFARLTGTAPIPVASGITNRMRLHHGGDRQANKIIHFITIGRLRTDERSKAYLAKKMGEGKSKKDAIRALKRHIAREIYGALKTDLKPLDKL